MIKELLNYQTEEAKLIAVEKELMQSEERKRVVRAKNVLDDTESMLSKFDERALELKNQIARIDAKSNQLIESLNEYKGIAESSKSIEEVDYLAKKMAKIEEDINACDREMKKLIADTRSHLQQYDDYKNKVKAAMQEYKENKQKLDELRESKKSEMDKLSASLKKLEASVNAELMAKYRKVRDKKIFPAVVPLRGKICTGCGMELSLVKQSKISADGIIECEECGRLVYVES